MAKKAEFNKGRCISSFRLNNFTLFEISGSQSITEGHYRHFIFFYSTRRLEEAILPNAFLKSFSSTGETASVEKPEPF
jgi:hypothetical protein